MDVDSLIDVVYQCMLCNEKSPTIDFLREHIRNFHSAQEIKKNTDESACTSTKRISVLVEQDSSLLDEIDNGKRFLRKSGKRKKKEAKYESQKVIAPKKGHNETSSPVEGNEKIFVCNFCAKTCKTAKGLSIHIKSCLTKRACTKCDSGFKTEEEMHSHEQCHYENNTFKCMYCDYVNVHWTQVKIHMETHNKPDTHKCSECEMAFASSHSLRNHWRFYHLGGKHLCDECGFEALSNYQLCRHRMSKHSLKYPCAICNYTSDNQIDLDEHTSSRHADFMCKHCVPPTTHATQEALSIHMNEAHQGKKCFLCDKCNYVTKLRHHLDKHYLMHSGMQPYKCDEEGCEYSTKDARNLKQHIVVKHSKPGDLVCRYCNFVTSNQNEWDVHRAMNHMKVYQCAKCPYKAFSSASLRRHRLAKHVDFEKMRYPCTQCSYRTNFRENLNKHQLTHILRNSRHKCPFCKLNLSNRDELQSHLNVEHSEKKVFLCKLCSYACKKAQAFRSHSLTHSDVKKQCCQFCEYSAKTKAALKSHVLRKHMTNLGDTASTEDQMQSGYSDDYISEKINRLPTNSTMGKQDTVSVLGLADGQCEAQSTLNVPLPAILTSETLSLAGPIGLPIFSVAVCTGEANIQLSSSM